MAARGQAKRTSRPEDGDVAEAATDGRAEPSPGRTAGKPAPGLHVVAVPIGNLGDLSGRALATLRDADVVACEDTRVTARLLAAYGVKRRLQRYDDHVAESQRPKLLAALADNASVALASDAGTPLVSDPGYKLVQAAIEAGLPVFAVPGPSAVLAALAIAGLPTDRFLFAGFLPNKSAARRQALAELAAVPATLVFFESAERVAKSLSDAEDVLGDRPAAVTRELTKRFEEARRGTLGDLARHYAQAPTPKGEIVLVVGAPLDDVAEASADDVDRLLAEALRTQAVAGAATLVAAQTGLPRRELYQRALTLRRSDP
ncbi:16S rRNA (cytidine(1402)-2'-O)-methyltransferase [Marinivivus vitaminiproducens]|uniref:16S rRNA (cytidine(1402)-2'-O)-methyltransferase n=1 Tax=Marinivivus vitaminiproducens TaxID=3035935 RepID=UPI00279E085E|nr:16S rRNA (cytidine(1402)-2'-O)-methyltransferase [Geminicoccaceae bacterium SCSIO 64248]